MSKRIGCPEGFKKVLFHEAVKVKIGRANTILVNGKIYDWNSAYKLYNARDNYNQLKWKDIGVEICRRK